MCTSLESGSPGHPHQSGLWPWASGSPLSCFWLSPRTHHVPQAATEGSFHLSEWGWIFNRDFLSIILSEKNKLSQP